MKELGTAVDFQGSLMLRSSGPLRGLLVIPIGFFFQAHRIFNRRACIGDPWQASGTWMDVWWVFYLNGFGWHHALLHAPRFQIGKQERVKARSCCSHPAIN